MREREREKQTDIPTDRERQKEPGKQQAERGEFNSIRRRKRCGMKIAANVLFSHSYAHTEYCNPSHWAHTHPAMFQVLVPVGLEGLAQILSQAGCGHTLYYKARALPTTGRQAPQTYQQCLVVSFQGQLMDVHTPYPEIQHERCFLYNEGR